VALATERQQAVVAAVAAAQAQEAMRQDPALEERVGSVLTLCKPRHRHQAFLEFLRRIDKSVPADLDVHCIVDNHSSHKHPKVKAWLAARPRWHLHFIPAYSSWLNQVERFFSIIAKLERLCARISGTGH
jgi:transposase